MFNKSNSHSRAESLEDDNCDKSKNSSVFQSIKLKKSYLEISNDSM